MPSPFTDRLRSQPLEEKPMVDESRLRFSLRTMLIVLTIASLMLAALFAFPDAWATGTLIVLLQIVPLVSLVGALWGGRYERAFCLGALIPAAITLLTLAPMWVLFLFDYPYSDNFAESLAQVGKGLEEYDQAHRVAAGLSWMFGILMGLIALALRRWVFRGGS
jgi:hypothetical protein